MEELVKYVSDIIEFLVGGVLLIVTALLFLELYSPESMGALHDAVTGIPASFATATALAGVGLAYAAGVVAEGVSRLAMEWRLTQLTMRPDYFGRPKKQAIDEREKWRLHVRTFSEQGSNEITGQLKRLRIERTFLLTSALSAVALVFDARWVPFLILTALAVPCVGLVNERFKRYLDTIVRTHDGCDTCIADTLQDEGAPA